jgi:acyl-CoA thioester hydrolase
LQIVWHGNYLKYFDIARFGLFKQAGVDLYQYLARQQIVFPVTRFSVKHIVPLRFDDEFICKATVTEAVYKIAIDFEIRLPENGRVCTRGKKQLSIAERMRFEIPGEITQALDYLMDPLRCICRRLKAALGRIFWMRSMSGCRADTGANLRSASRPPIRRE